MTPAQTTRPLISVVTVCLNAQAHIARALQSVADQTYDECEHVIIDGMSTDNTLEIVKRYAQESGARIRWLSEKDAGLYDAMNKGVKLATGGMIGILNADDHYEPDVLERVAAAWAANPDAGVIYGDDYTFDPAGNRRLRPTPERVTLKDMKRDHIVHHHASFVARTVYDELGVYNTAHPIAADYDFFLRCAENDVRFVRIDGVVTNFSLEGESHKNIRKTDRDATLVRIEHGVSPVAAWARFQKRKVAFWTYRQLKGLPGFKELYEQYRRMLSR